MDSLKLIFPAFLSASREARNTFLRELKDDFERQITPIQGPRFSGCWPQEQIFLVAGLWVEWLVPSFDAVTHMELLC